MVSPVMGADHFLYPGIYATAGNSTNGRASVDLSAYSSVSFNNRHLISVGYSDTRLKHRDWTYGQQMLVGGMALTFRPITVKAHYAHIDGDFNLDDRLYSYRYNDHADLGSAELVYGHWPWYAGIGAMYFNGIGYRKQTVQQWTARLEHPLGRTAWLSLRPSYAWVLDGRRLWSAEVKASWQPHRNWIFRAGGMAGERAYAFDNDLLVIYNQDETQTRLLSAQAEARLWRGFWLSGQYLYTQFRGYSIRYLVAGLHSRLPL